MSGLTIRSADDCRYDLVALGEVMLRLDPGEDRVRTARAFRVWEGGGEYNVARGLRRCFSLRTAIVTALVENDIGRLIDDLMLQGGVDTSLVRWTADDGVGRTVRNGLNFTERGFGVRGALGVSDRGNTAASQLAPGQIDWDELFGQQWSKKPSPRPRATARSCPTTSITGRVCGRGSAASNEHARSTAASPDT
jgi:2-dehydro-3-deoxygluconokinase